MSHSPLYEELLSLMRKAGQIILTAREANVAQSVTEKVGTANFVTDFDVRVQEFLLAGAKKILPDAIFIAEEKENDMEQMTAEH